MSTLKGKVALVTGSTSGIGLTVARALGAQGADLMLNGLGDTTEIERARASLEGELKVRVRYHGADMTKSEQIRDMVATCQRELGAVDILVNNAGIQHVAPIEKFPEDKWDAIIAINLTSAFHTTKAAIPLMRARKWGRIINIASAHG
ncbi:MAG: SDR family NAD(P)-dependent oxidoreductase, partial [Burkholderiales bacterium]